MKKSDPKTPPEQLTAYERWELPVIGEEFENRQSASKSHKPPTAAELEGIREAAYEEGLEQGKAEGLKAGRDEGYRKGLEEGKQEGLKLGTAKGEAAALKVRSAAIQAQMTQFEQLLRALQQPIQECQEEVEEAMLNLIFAISRSVIFRELTMGPTQIATVVREALAALPNTEEQVTVYISPADAAYLEEHLPADHTYRYSKDSKMMAGGCRVETRHTLLDYTVEKRFQAAIQQLLSRHSDETESSDAHDYTDQMGEMSDFHRDLLESAVEEAAIQNPAAKSIDDAEEIVSNETENKSKLKSDPDSESGENEASLKHPDDFPSGERSDHEPG
ncbi:flagellar assembly protein FliH [Hahella ganghwensis]|uniref:flagellar assembly protein FliH n=1 Tax=Hahella ganghwensis TaxID=286420 RepID=UPI00036C12E7|nr:flagellar assembly protein FliH [Hahella ganghwensis]